MPWYNYKIPAISVIYRHCPASSTEDKQRCKERDGSEVQKKSSCVGVAGSCSELRLWASPGACPRLVACLCKWAPRFSGVNILEELFMDISGMSFSKEMRKKKAMFVVKSGQKIDKNYFLSGWKKVFEWRLKLCPRCWDVLVPWPGINRSPTALQHSLLAVMLHGNGGSATLVY